MCVCVCGASDPLIETDIVYVVTGQVDVRYLAWGWKGRNEGDGAGRSQWGGILLMHSLIFSLIGWLISSQTVGECAGVQA